MKPLLLMRTKGITGPLFAKHIGIKGLSKAGAVSGDLPLRPVIGWNGTVNCADSGTGIVTMRFTKPVSYTNGLSGVTISHDNGGVFTLVSVSGEGTNDLIYNGSWNIEPVYGDDITYSYVPGDYEDSDGEPMDAASASVINCVATPLEILSYIAGQLETPNGNRIIRSQYIDVLFNQGITATDSTGVTATVHGATQSVTLSKPNTTTLRYTLQRAIFRHDVTWAYDGLGDIHATLSGEELGAIGQVTVTNDLPEFTVFDYDAGALDANTDTTFDTDETRHDEV